MQTVLTHTKFLALVITLGISFFTADAQRLRLGIYSGYISQSFDAFSKEPIRISGSRYTGFDVEYLLDEMFGVKLGYSRQNATAALPCDAVASNTAIERYEIGFTARKAIVEKKLDWSTGLGFGLCQLFGEHEQPDESRFTTSFNAGLHYHISNHIGLQLHGRLLQFYSKAISECAPGIQAKPAGYGTVVSQGAVTGGLLFTIGK